MTPRSSRYHHDDPNDYNDDYDDGRPIQAGRIAFAWRAGYKAPTMSNGANTYDAIVIGSGFGGTMAAQAMMDGGMRVLMIERGDWVPRSPASWGDEGSMELTPHYSKESPLHMVAGGYNDVTGACYCVGGPSVFYGCVSYRFRPDDFYPPTDIVADSGARWPLDYQQLEPYYSRAEALLDVSGDDGADPTRPPRSAPYPQPAPPLAPISQRIANAARELGLSPFPLPLAINFREHAAKLAETGGARSGCQRCRTCDTYACAIGAKNDLATAVLPSLMARGLTLRTGTAVRHIEVERGRARAVHCVERSGDGLTDVSYRADVIVVAAGTLATPHLLLASGLAEHSPAPAAVGRYLMRHCNAMVFGVFHGEADPEHVFHKQLAINDYYFGDAQDIGAGYDDDLDGDGPDGDGLDGTVLRGKGRGPLTKLGGIQQVMTPPASLVRARAPRGLRTIAGSMVQHLTGLLVIAEDQPQIDNGVSIDASSRDAIGLPKLLVEHRYTSRDQLACNMLIRRAKRILRQAGALFFHTHHIKTFSHAVGTVRMGDDASTAPLDRWGRFRGVDNLFVSDGSALPTSAGVNPSLTIAANALRIGGYIAGGYGARGRGARDRTGAEFTEPTAPKDSIESVDPGAFTMSRDGETQASGGAAPRASNIGGRI